MRNLFFLCFAITLIILIVLQPFQIEDAESLQNGDKINLLDDTIIWNTTQNVELNKTGEFLNMTIDTNMNKGKKYNRIFTITNLTELYPGPLLKLTYSTNSTQGNPKFIFEMRGPGTLLNQSNGTDEKEVIVVPKFLGSIDLGHTLGYFTTRQYELPPYEPSSNHEFRFYIITDGPTDAYLAIKNATIFSK